MFKSRDPTFGWEWVAAYYVFSKTGTSIQCLVLYDTGVHLPGIAEDFTIPKWTLDVRCVYITGTAMLRVNS